ncbi:uncharacterized protein [Dendropsophus ebraccatus]|uniref:uncharacterized protein n=1 Tax=Dendropsophus ebraccatus TaxID=150705 RepID=UPI0038312E41
MAPLTDPPSVINISEVELPEGCVSLLSKGLNFGLNEKFSFVSFESDLYKAVRKINLHKFFAIQNKTPSCAKPSKIHYAIGPLGFFPPTTFSTQEQMCILDLATMDSQDNTQDVNYAVSTDEPFTGGNPSTFAPQVTPGSPIDLFQKAVLRDAKALLYPQPHSNLTTKEQKALTWLKSRPDLLIKRADKGGATVVMTRDYYVQEAHRQLQDARTYSRLSKDPTPKIKEQLRSLLHKHVTSGVIDSRTAERLIPESPRVPKWYLLPKIHKSLSRPPGRPIVSAVGSVTEGLSQYLDWALRPILKCFTSYLKDTNDFLLTIRDFQWCPAYSLASVDVESLYTRIPHDAGVEAIHHILTGMGKSSEFKLFIKEALLFVLQNNCFTFEGDWYRQETGTAMGTPVSCTYANLFLAWLEVNSVFAPVNPFCRDILLYKRFVDDIFIVWSSTADRFDSFISYLNNTNTCNMFFTSNFGGNSLEFLDVLVTATSTQLHTTVFRKHTAANALLHYESSHPPQVRNSIPYGQMLRIKRINYTETGFQRQANELKSRLLSRGYPQSVIDKAYTRVSAIDRASLHHSRHKSNTNSPNASDDKRFSFILQNTQMNNTICNIIKKHWFLLQQDPDIAAVAHRQPLITFRKNATIGDSLNRSTPKRNLNWLQQSRPEGNKRCGSCSYCSQMYNTSFLNLAGQDCFVRDLITCRTTHVIYAILCPCHRFYIGKTKRPLWTRFKEHLYSVRTGKGVPRLIEHVRTVHQSNTKLLQFFGLERVNHTTDGSDRLKLLLKRETQWILKLDATGPCGLNERNDMNTLL